ncbi:MAG: NAD(P)-dependent oxidoreductase, partial [Pseudomonadota bacterium]
MSGKPTIGFIGVGLMGHGMAKNVVEKGYDLVIMGHRNRAPVEDLVARGASEATSPAETAAKADIIHLCVTGSPQVEAIVLGADGLLAHAEARHTLIDTSTSQPPSSIRIAEALAEKGARFADAPLSRTPKEAEAGTLDTMVGADDETFAIIEPVLKTWAGVVVR